tara:strand:- start:537 stop:1760 length:1224 start_codon:yes stop_codon:yes gene_type:complete
MESSRDDFVIAIRSAFLKKETQQRFSLLGLIFFSIIFLVLSNLNLKPIYYVKTIINEIVYRSSYIVSGPENFLKKNYIIIVDHFKLYENNKKNIIDLNSLKRKDLSKKIITLENIKYKKLIDDYFIKDNETFAKVLIDKQSPFLRSIIINKGSKNNIKLGMIVLDEGYLVGKVVKVNYTTSRVLLISDINSKIPVSLQPGDYQAIMTGKNNKNGVLQYIKDKDLKDNKEEFIVITSGAGGLFISGIPIGKIKNEESNLNNGDIIVHYYQDFSQLKYVKVVSYSKERESLDIYSKKDSEKQKETIDKVERREESLRILLEEKKIANEIRIKIGEENNTLKKNIIKYENEIMAMKNEIKKNDISKDELKFLKLNLTYGHKCRKNPFNNKYKVGSERYRKCVLNKGLKLN